MEVPSIVLALISMRLIWAPVPPTQTGVCMCESAGQTLRVVSFSTPCVHNKRHLLTAFSRRPQIAWKGPGGSIIFCLISSTRPMLCVVFCFMYIYLIFPPFSYVWPFRFCSIIWFLSERDRATFSPHNFFLFFLFLRSLVSFSCFSFRYSFCVNQFFFFFVSVRIFVKENINMCIIYVMYLVAYDRGIRLQSVCYRSKMFRQKQSWSHQSSVGLGSLA